ncbi:MAG: hypothetical protein HFI74_03860 [Lachnospiraceae bacterium]|jgi:hypothetical protein|nr:hypothetical protein [Lachnospiraceae bacterium]
MREHGSKMELEEIIRTSMKMTDVPAPELNDKLKVALYQQEVALQKQPDTHKLSLWYLPMVLNLITCSLLGLVALIMIENIYLSYFAAGICFYVGLVGVLLTIVGVKRANLKEEITVHIQKRGVMA